MPYYVVSCTRKVNPRKLVDKPSEKVYVDGFFFKPEMKVKDIGVCEFTDNIGSAGVFTLKTANRVLDKMRERFVNVSEMDCHFYNDFHLERVVKYREDAFNMKTAIDAVEVNQ